VYHKWCNNRTEQIHGLVVNPVLPKCSYFYQVICGQARVYLAVRIDSLGYYKYYEILYLELGMTMSSITTMFYHQPEKKRRANQLYANKPVWWKIRAQQWLDNINKEWQSEVVDK
jgi:hypothetical protein